MRDDSRHNIHVRIEWQKPLDNEHHRAYINSNWPVNMDLSPKGDIESVVSVKPHVLVGIIDRWGLENLYQHIEINKKP